MGDHGDVEMPQIRLLGFAIKQELERRPRRKFFRRDVTIEGPRLVMSIGTLERNGPMTAKVDLLTAAPDVMKAWTGAALAIAASLEPSLMELVKIRASQINGCANCINMHAAEARSQGETEQRIYLLPAWREAPCYTERERAALGWTEALTRLSEGHTHESAYGALKAQFSDEEQVKLTLMINVINGWNRLSVGFGTWLEPAAAKAAARAAA